MNKVIKKPGVYYLNNKNLRLEVSKGKGLLKYILKDSDNRVLLEQDDNASIYHRWALFFDNIGNLWVHSSDIGIFIWEKDSLNRYQKILVQKGSKWYRKMPNEFLDQLPSSLK